MSLYLDYLLYKIYDYINIRFLEIILIYYSPLMKLNCWCVQVVIRVKLRPPWSSA